MRAARLFGAAEAIRVDINNPLPQDEQQRREKFLSEVRKALGDRAFDAEWYAGMAMEQRQAIAYGRELFRTTFINRCVATLKNVGRVVRLDGYLKPSVK